MGPWVIALDDTTFGIRTCDARRSVYQEGSKLMLLYTRQPLCSTALVPSPHAIRRPFGIGDLVGRLIQVTLALYLLPVLLLVLAVSGAGMAILAVARLFTSLSASRAAW